MSRKKYQRKIKNQSPSIHSSYIFLHFDDNRYVRFYTYREKCGCFSGVKSRRALASFHYSRHYYPRQGEDVTRSISLAKIRSRTCSLVRNARRKCAESATRGSGGTHPVEIELGFAARTLSSSSLRREGERDTKARVE